QENFTVKLLELLRQGEIDVAILAEPFPDQGLVTQALYDEPFAVAVPHGHPWAGRESVESLELKEQTMLLLGTGHCFRDQVLEVCPELSRYSQASAGIQKTFEGSSLETIRHMVASGIGITVLPWTAMPPGVREGTLNSVQGATGQSTPAQPPAVESANAVAGGAEGARATPQNAAATLSAGESHSDGLLTYVPFHPV